MRLLINTASAFKGGSVQVANSFLRECRGFSEHEYGVVVGPGLDDVLRATDFPDNFRIFRLSYRPAQRVLSWRSAAKDLAKFEAEFSPDVVFTTSGPSYWRPRAPHLMGFNLAHNLYPDSPFFKHVLNSVQRLRWRLKSIVIHHFTQGFADAWVVQTDDVNQRLRSWISSDQVSTVPNTISDAYEAARAGIQADRSLIRSRSADFRLLVLSSYYPHKDLEIVERIIDLLKKADIRDIRFTMTLPPSDFEDVISPENRDWVDNLGPQLPQDCPALYSNSDVLFMPSLLECFSANFVEAMAMRRPIIATDLGFAQTICRGAARYYEPLNASAALRQIRVLQDSEEERKKLVVEGQREFARFGSARKRAESYLTICKSLVSVGKSLSC